MSTRAHLIRRAVAVTAVTGLAFGLAGCGDEDLRRGASAGGAEPSKTVKVDDSDALSKTEIMTAAYQSSLKAGSAHMTMTMTAKGQQVTDMQGDVSYAGGKPSMQATMTIPQMGAGKLEMRYVGNILYTQIPGIDPAREVHGHRPQGLDVADGEELRRAQRPDGPDGEPEEDADGRQERGSRREGDRAGRRGRPLQGRRGHQEGDRGPRWRPAGGPVAAAAARSPTTCGSTRRTWCGG